MVSYLDQRLNDKTQVGWEILTYFFRKKFHLNQESKDWSTDSRIKFRTI